MSGEGTYHNDRGDEHNHHHETHHKVHVLPSLGVLLGLLLLLFRQLASDTTLGGLGILRWEDGLDPFFNL